MLDRFIVANREAIIENAGTRRRPTTTDTELTSGIPLFLDQLGDVLRLANSRPVVDQAALIASAGKHGRDLLAQGLTIGQVVHDYGGMSLGRPRSWLESWTLRSPPMSSASSTCASTARLPAP